ncbi:hypothetical protein ACFSTC_61365 [Nonomuraea ferruginea]
MMAVVGVVSGCGTITAAQPPLEGPGVLTLEKAQPPTPGGEVGGASTEFASAKDLSMWLKLSEKEKDVDRLAKMDVGKTAKGAMYLEPKTSAWFDGFRGPFVYQDLAERHRHARQGEGRGQERRQAQAQVLARRPDGPGAGLVRQRQLGVDHHRHDRQDRLGWSRSTPGTAAPSPRRQPSRAAGRS